jgi:putative ABC transport system permease protein
MLYAAFQDLMWRRRRVVIAVLAVSLALGLSLVMAGVTAAFGREADQVLRSIGGESFLMRKGELGVFTSASVVDVDAAPNARPFAFWNAPVRSSTRGLVQSALLSSEPGWPSGVVDGTALQRPGDVVVDRSLGVEVGESVLLADRRLRVVGRTQGTTLYGGQPVLFIHTADAQQLMSGGANVTKGFVESGRPSSPPPSGLVRVERSSARSDLLRPLANAQQSLVLIMVLLWTVAASIVASVVFLAVLERTRDIAVFKATGVPVRSIAWGVLLQAGVIAGTASLMGVVLAHVIAPAFAMPVVITRSTSFLLPVLALGIAVVASLAGLRRVARIEPAFAFGGP